MKRSITVCVGEAAVEVGTLTFDARGARKLAGFSYAPSWLGRADRFAVSPDLTLGEGHQYRANKARDESAFFACFADLEPDGWGRIVILRDHAKRRKLAKPDRSPAGPLDDYDYLLCVSDYARIGALRLRDEEGVFQRAADGKSETPALLDLPQLLSASRAVEENTETARDLEYLRGNGTSLGGMRPKCSVRDADGSLAIGKFPSVDDSRSIVHGEVLALNLARAAGIDAARARVVDSGGVPVAIISRFDRLGDKRLMYLSARSLMLATSAHQYTYLDLADTIRQHSSRAAADLKQLWRRLIFNILINNVDDHLNNHGFLHQAHGQWRLSPAFDLNPFPDKTRALKTWISNDVGDAASVGEAVAVAPLFGYASTTEARAVLVEVSAVVAKWKKLARTMGMSARDIDQFAPAFEHTERNPRAR